MAAFRTTPTLAEQVYRLETLVTAQARVLDLVGDNAPLDTVLQELCELFHAQIPGAVASIALANRDGSAHVVGKAPNLEQAYWDGNAAWRREPVIVEDIAIDPEWESSRQVALAAGLRACWAVPIVGSDDRILGTFAAYWQDVTTPAEHDVWVQHQFARLTQIAIERAQTTDRITEVLESDRRRIAGAIHDDPIQVMTGAALRLQRLASNATSGQAELLSTAQLGVNSAIDRLRHMVFELHPPDLEAEGIVAAIEAYVEQSVDSNQIDWTVDAALDFEPPLAIGSLAYRLAREAIANVVKHSHATQMTVALSSRDDGIQVRVIDNGCGIDPSISAHHEAGHIGLTNCHYLALRAAGRWSISSASAGGTVVEFWIPITVMD